MPLVSPHLRLEYDYDGRINVLEVAVDSASILSN